MGIHLRLGGDDWGIIFTWDSFQDSLYGFPRLFTATSEHIRLFTFYFFSVFTLFSCRFRAVD